MISRSTGSTSTAALLALSVVTVAMTFAPSSAVEAAGPTSAAGAERAAAPTSLQWSGFSPAPTQVTAAGRTVTTTQGATGVWEYRSGGNGIQTASAQFVNGAAVWGPVTTHQVPGGNYAGFVTAVAAQDRVLVAYRGDSGLETGFIDVQAARVDGRTEVWAAPVRISTPNLINAGMPYLALAADGRTAIAMWEEWSGVDYRVHTSIGRLRGEQFTWTAPRLMDSAGSSFSRAVAISADGSRAIALWNSATGLVSSVASVGTTDVTWSSAQTLEPASRFPSVVEVRLSSDGRMVVAAWKAAVNFASVVRASSGAIGTEGQVTWSEPTTITPGLGGAGGGLSLAASDDLAAVMVTWYHLYGSIQTPYVAIGRRTGGQVTWGTQVEIPGATPGVDPVVSLTPDGSWAVFAWSDLSGGEVVSVGVVRARLSAGALRWSDPTDLRYADGSALLPSVGFGPGGNLAIGASVTLPNASGARFALAVGARPAAASVSVTIDGRKAIGRAVRAVTSVTGVPAPTLTYRWSRKHGSTYVAIPGATGRSYTVADADAGRLLRVTVTATNEGGTARSSATVRAGRRPQEAIGLPPLPEQLRTGLTLIAPGPVTTTAGQTARITVTWRPRQQPRGEVGVRSVVLAGGGVGVYVPAGATGTVTISVRADATERYQALALTRDYALS